MDATPKTAVPATVEPSSITAQELKARQEAAARGRLYVRSVRV